MTLLIGRSGLIESIGTGITPIEAKSSKELTLREYLFTGATLSIEVLDKRSRSKVKKRKPFLHLCKVPHVANDAVMISFEGAGSWVIYLSKKVKPMDIYRCGLSMVASKALAAKLNEGKENG